MPVRSGGLPVPFGIRLGDLISPLGDRWYISVIRHEIIGETGKAVESVGQRCEADRAIALIRIQPVNDLERVMVELIPRAVRRHRGHAVLVSGVEVVAVDEVGGYEAESIRGRRRSGGYHSLVVAIVVVTSGRRNLIIGGKDILEPRSLQNHLTTRWSGHRSTTVARVGEDREHLLPQHILACGGRRIGKSDLWRLGVIGLLVLFPHATSPFREN